MHIFAVRDFQVHGLKDREHILLNPCVSLVIPVTYEDLHSDCNNRTRRQVPADEKAFHDYISVDSIDDALAKVTAAGGTIALPKTEIGQGMGFIAAFKDTEGNILGFHQSPKK